MMRKFIVTTGVIYLLSVASVARAQETPMERFRESAVLLLKGISALDRVALTDAAELFSGLNMSEFEDYTVIQSSSDALSASDIMFTSEYCDLLRKNNFETVRMEALDMMRGDGSGDILTVTRRIAPSAKAIFTFSGEEEVGVLVASPALSSLLVTITGTDFNKTPENDGNGYTSTSSINLGTGDGEFNVEIENTSSLPISFVIALQ